MIIYNTDPEVIVLVDDNDVPLAFTEPTAEQFAIDGRKADLYHAQQLGEEAALGDPWCAAVGAASFKNDPEAQAAFDHGYNTTIQRLNKENNEQSQ